MIGADIACAAYVDLRHFPLRIIGAAQILDRDGLEFADRLAGDCDPIVISSLETVSIVQDGDYVPAVHCDRGAATAAIEGEFDVRVGAVVAGEYLYAVGFIKRLGRIIFASRQPNLWMV